MPREDAVLAYDTRRRALLLFGGRANGVVYADTWEWRDSTWVKRAGAADGPGALEHAAGAYDPSRGRLVIFGGARQGASRESTIVWEWDGQRWHQADVPGPLVRIGHTMTYSTRAGGIALYGGFNATGSLTDLWCWDGTQWAQLDSAGPTYTEGYALVETDSGMVVLGTGRTTADPWTLPLSAWRFRNREWHAHGVPGPPGMVGQSVTYDAGRSRVVVFGGAVPGAPPSARTWELGDGHWLRGGG